MSQSLPPISLEPRWTRATFRSMLRDRPIEPPPEGWSINGLLALGTLANLVGGAKVEAGDEPPELPGTLTGEAEAK